MLPIKRVVLFKHGVGYFQRSGEVDGDQLVELNFKASQMNDVLKSLTTLDYGGGNFAALSYDSEEPLDRRLAELNMAIPDKGAISAFLDGLKGARVALVHGGEELEGVVVGIEEVQRKDNQSLVRDAHLAVLADGCKLVRVPLLDVKELQLVDESVQRDLQSLLDIFFTGLRKDRKRLSIQARGSGKREIALSYVVEAPVWKTSYRIVLPGEKSKKSLLQGWALVDNTTDDDWEGVRLSLVSGLPISFIHDLYTPRYRRRPVVQEGDEAAVAPPVVEYGRKVARAGRDDNNEDLPRVLEKLSAPNSEYRNRLIATSSGAASMADAAKESVEVNTSHHEAGDLFTYEITLPVHIGRSRSALVPILQSETEMERVALYNSEIRDTNPLTAFRIENDTGLTLEGGPVTVFEGDSYVGEAMLQTMRKGDERLTPYSVELGVTAKHEESQVRKGFTRVTKQGNYIYKYFKKLRLTRYVFDSSLNRAVDLYVDHRFRFEGREDTPEPVEITDNFWRFKIELAPGKSTDFTVCEVGERNELIDVRGLARADVIQMASDNLISERTKADLEMIADKAAEAQDIESGIFKRKDEERKIGEGQERLRENLKALGNSDEEAVLRTRYVASLTKDEETLEQLTSGIAELNAQLKREQGLLSEMVDALDFGEE